MELPGSRKLPDSFSACRPKVREGLGGLGAGLRILWEDAERANAPLKEQRGKLQAVAAVVAASCRYEDIGGIRDLAEQRVQESLCRTVHQGKRAAALLPCSLLAFPYLF